MSKCKIAFNDPSFILRFIVLICGIFIEILTNELCGLAVQDNGDAALLKAYHRSFVIIAFILLMEYLFCKRTFFVELALVLACLVNILVPFLMEMIKTQKNGSETSPDKSKFLRIYYDTSGVSELSDPIFSNRLVQLVVRYIKLVALFCISSDLVFASTKVMN